MTEIITTTVGVPSIRSFGLRIDIDGDDFEFPCISERRDDVERLSNRFVQEDVDVLHFEDIIVDYIMELAYARIERCLGRTH